MRHQLIKREQIDFTHATLVISAAQKFIIPVPELSDGEPLKYPSDYKDPSGEARSGSILDWQKKPIEGTGIVFYNYKDNTIQAIKGNGNSVIIINSVTQKQADKLHSFINDYCDGKPSTRVQIQAVLDKAKDMGLTDRYNSDMTYVTHSLNKIGHDGALGLYKRKTDVCQAVFVSGQGSFQGPAGSSQQFLNGAVLVRHGEDVRLIQKAIFFETYTLCNGSKITRQEQLQSAVFKLPTNECKTPKSIFPEIQTKNPVFKVPLDECKVSVSTTFPEIHTKSTPIVTQSQTSYPPLTVAIGTSAAISVSQISSITQAKAKFLKNRSVSTILGASSNTQAAVSFSHTTFRGKFPRSLSDVKESRSREIN